MRKACLSSTQQIPYLTSIVTDCDQQEYTAEGEEQPLGNHAVYLKYTKVIEDLLERFLRQHGLDQEVGIVH